MWFLWFILFLIWVDYNHQIIEYGSTSPGTMLQLVAKGPQDVYLTGWDYFYTNPKHLYRPYFRYYSYHW